MSDFTLKQVQSIAEFNPSEQLKKGVLAKCVPMAKLKEFQRKITGYELKPFSGGAKFRNGDILVAKITPCLENGKTAFVDILADNEIAFGSTEFIVLRARNDTNPEFLYYFAISPDFRKRAIECMEGTSGRKRVNENTLKTLELPIPNLKTQKSIAHILSTLDQKIAINNQINAQLEQMAKTLYDYWFVQFDFPDENGKPYKSSGGEMVYNDTLKREIPKGWEVKSLGEVVDLKNGINYSASDYGDTQAKIVNVRDVSNCSIFIKSNELDILSLDNKKLLPYQINEKNILVVRSGKPGATRLLGNVKDLTIYCGFIIAIVPKKEIMRNLIFWFLKNQELKIESQSAGTVLKNVSQDTLKGSLFLIPNSKNLILKFNTLIDDIFKKKLLF